jgi:drug/metabolite transporter (DMT)-like permease
VFNNISKTNQSLFLLIILGMLWGTGFSIAKYVMMSGFSPVLYLFVNIILPVSLLNALTYKKLNIFKLLYANKKFFTVITLTGILLPDLTRYIVTQHLPSGTIGVLTNTVPLFIYPMSLLAGEERFSILRFFGIGAGVLGIMLIVFNGNAAILHLQYNKFVFFTLLSPFCYAFCSIYIVKNRPENCDSMAICTGMLTLAMLITLPMVLFSHHPGWHGFHYSHIVWILCFGIILSTIGYILLFEILRKSGAVCYSLTDGIVAITSLFLGSIFLHERLGLYGICGVFCVMLGLLLVMRQQGFMGRERVNTEIQ